MNYDETQELSEQFELLEAIETMADFNGLALRALYATLEAYGGLPEAVDYGLTGPEIERLVEYVYGWANNV